MPPRIRQPLHRGADGRGLRPRLRAHHRTPSAPGGLAVADEIIRVNDAYYIVATSTRVDDRRRVLKHGDTFAVFDRYGDIENVGPPEFGVYHQDTRFLSRLSLRL